MLQSLKHTKKCLSVAYLYMYLECKPKDVQHMTGTQPERKMKNFVELIHLMTVICTRCENTFEKLVNLSYYDSQCSIAVKGLNRNLSEI